MLFHSKRLISSYNVNARWRLDECFLYYLSLSAFSVKVEKGEKRRRVQGRGTQYQIHSINSSIQCLHYNLQALFIGLVV